MHNHIAAQCLNRAAANGKALIVKARHAPEDKAYRHRDRLTGADRAVTDNAVFTLVLLHFPPQQRHFLPLAESLVDHQSPPLR